MFETLVAAYLGYIIICGAAAFMTFCAVIGTWLRLRSVDQQIRDLNQTVSDICGILREAAEQRERDRRAAPLRRVTAQRSDGPSPLDL